MVLTNILIYLMCLYMYVCTNKIKIKISILMVTAIVNSTSKTLHVDSALPKVSGLLCRHHAVCGIDEKMIIHMYVTLL